MIGEDFKHVENLMLRRILQSEPRHVTHGDLHQAFDWSMGYLGRDVINTDVPAIALDQRIAAAREANVAILKRQNTRALKALQRFWAV